MSNDPFSDPADQKKYLKIALSGEGGVGKTRAALSFPKPCVVDTENGTEPYRKNYEFKKKFANRWRHLDALMTWLRGHPGVYETLIIDSGTVFYLDLIQDIVDFIKNKRGNEIMTPGDWGVQKRRWAAWMNQLVELPMHVILSFREKPEYEETTNKRGEEVRKKTGNYLPEWDKQTEHLFDLCFRCYTEEDKKNKTSKFLMACTKTRYDWMPKYSVHDVTKQRAFQTLFEPHVVQMLTAPDPPPPVHTEPLIIIDTEKTEAEKVQEAITTVAGAAKQDIVEAVEKIGEKKIAEATGNDLATAPGAPDDPPVNTTPNTPEMNCQELKRFFGTPPIEKDQPEATADDLKLLMERGAKMRWADDSKKCRKQGCSANGHIHPWFQPADAKSMIRCMYNVESSRDLRKPQVDFLYGEFAKVLAEQAFLDRDKENTVYIATPVGTTEEEVRRNVLTYTK